MKHLTFSLTALFMLLSAFPIFAQTRTTDKPFKGHFVNKENNVHLYMDLYEESIVAPGYDFLGKMNGYLIGNIYGTWFMVSHQVNDNKATLRFTNDQGSDSQTVELTCVNDSTLSYHATGPAVIRKVDHRKLVKIPTTLTLSRYRQ